jgi:hypothetical protein
MFLQSCFQAFYETHREGIDMTIALFAIISLVLAVTTEIGIKKLLYAIKEQFRNTESMSNKMNEQLKSINEISDTTTKQFESINKISESLSTRYVGNFPENMDAIIDLISRTKHKLVILTDVPAYG